MLAEREKKLDAMFSIFKFSLNITIFFVTFSVNDYVFKEFRGTKF